MYAIYWIGAVILFLIVEIMTLGLTSIWFAGGALLAALAAFIGAPILVQLLVFAAASCLLFTLTRPIAQKYLNNKVQKTNVEAVPGQHGMVKQSIDNLQEKGIVRVQGLDWSARSVDGKTIPEGTEVVICRIEGVKAIVDVPEEETEQETTDSSEEKQEAMNSSEGEQEE